MRGSDGPPMVPPPQRGDGRSTLRPYGTADQASGECVPGFPRTRE